MGPSSRRYADPVIESIGDSARGDEFALVRLTVDGDRIVSEESVLLRMERQFTLERLGWNFIRLRASVKVI